jgi:hypothetical protein
MKLEPLFIFLSLQSLDEISSSSSLLILFRRNHSNRNSISTFSFPLSSPQFNSSFTIFYPSLSCPHYHSLLQMNHFSSLSLFDSHRFLPMSSTVELLLPQSLLFSHTLSTLDLLPKEYSAFGNFLILFSSFRKVQNSIQQGVPE